MRNIWLIIRREYLAKVRTKSFIVSTLAMPLVIGLFILPSKLATLKNSGTHKLAVVAADAKLGAAVQSQLQQPPSGTRDGEESARDIVGQYHVEVSSDLSDNNREVLGDRLARKDIDGYIWLGPEQVSSRQVTYVRRETGDFVDQSAVRSAISNALIARELSSRGVSSAETADLLRDVRLDVVQDDHGKQKRVNTSSAFIGSFAMVLLLYTTILFYGIAIMRSVVEEKSSRIMEVMLSSVTPQDLLAGKIIGVAAVGLSQILIWVGMVALVMAPGVAATGLLQKAHISPVSLLAFPVFFLLGYLLYATMYATLGAVVNTEQEGQQMQIIIMLPLVVAISLVMLVVREPNGTVSTWVSMVPFVSPVLMYLRVAIQTPPLWQIALSLALLVATIYALLLLCARIYRIGILMYGKRPTLPEILKWLKYSGA